VGIAAYQFNRTRGSAVVWQLVSRNNRILGVSPVDFTSITAAATAAAAVRDQVSAAQVDVSQVDVSQEVGLQWRWSISDGQGRALAVGGRAYGRRIDCQYAVRRFIDEAARAEIDPAHARRGRFWRSEPARATE
jgi:hypothetical protein